MSSPAARLGPTRTSPGAVTVPRRRVTARRGETACRLLDAALEELREGHFDGLTVRGAARRAGLAPATAYNYFSSKEHLVAELFWRLVSGLPGERAAGPGSAADRAAAALAPLAEAVASEPELARACTIALLADDPDVHRLRDQISREWARRVTGAVDGDVSPGQIEVLLLAWSGALLAAGIGHLAYSDVPGRVAAAAGLILGSGR